MPLLIQYYPIPSTNNKDTFSECAKMTLTTSSSETRNFVRINFNKIRCASAPQLHYRTPRPVPAFSIQSLQKNTIVIDMAKFSAKNKQKYRDRAKEVRPTSFRKCFDRGDLPVKMEYLTGGDKIGWTVDIEKLDYSLYLPLFFDGICLTEHPYKRYARQGVVDLLAHGGDRIHPVIPQLILPIKNALSSNNLEVICTTLKILQQLVMSSDLVGPALVPFYRQLLPMFNSYRVKNLNCGDRIDYSQRHNMNLGDLIDETLQILEMHGGEDAFINIKYMVPTYESCFLN